jgi:imidazolonepropionase-like amidohydrolase
MSCSVDRERDQPLALRGNDQGRVPGGVDVTATHERGRPMHLRGIVLPQGVVRDVFVKDGRITFNEQGNARTLRDGGYLVPGLVDAHAHLALFSPAPEGASPGDRERASARAQLAAGVLAIREPGSPDHHSIGLGPHEGLPRVLTGGRFLAPPGGYFPGLAREVGEDDLPDAAEEEARASGAWAKLIGDFLGPEGMRPNWRLETLREAARRVHAVGAKITIHATLAEVIEAAIEAGFDAVEHGTTLGDDAADAMARRGIALVPTLFPLDVARGFVSTLPVSREVAESLIASFEGQPARVRRAVERGVRVFAGTDAGMGPHGLIADEVERFLALGMSPEAALGAASWSARTWLGLPGVEEGAPADIVAYADDPRGDPDVLRRPSLIMLDGLLVQGPGASG